MCYKVEYASKGEAQAAMHVHERSNPNRKNKKQMKLEAYRCIVCNKWHWGHAPTKKRFLRERKNDR